MAALADHRRSVAHGRAVDPGAGRAVASARGWLSTRHSLPIELALRRRVWSATSNARAQRGAAEQQAA
jgi:hypothetical protein